MLNDSGVDRLVAGVMAQAVLDAGSNDTFVATEARQWLKVCAPDLAKRLEQHNWRVGTGRRVSSRRLFDPARLQRGSSVEGNREGYHAGKASLDTGGAARVDPPLALAGLAV